MDWLAQNQVWIVIAVLFIGMHLLDHGGVGGGDDQRPVGGKRTGKDKPQGHQCWDDGQP